MHWSFRLGLLRMGKSKSLRLPVFLVPEIPHLQDRYQAGARQLQNNSTTESRPSQIVSQPCHTDRTADWSLPSN